MRLSVCTLIGTVCTLATLSCVTLSPKPSLTSTELRVFNLANRPVNELPYSLNEGDCGAVAIATVLKWHGQPAPLGLIQHHIALPALKASFKTEIRIASQNFGLISHEESGPERRPEDLFPFLASGYPVIVLENLGLTWMPIWHYSTVIAIDTERGHILLHGSRYGWRKVALENFQKTWSRSLNWSLLPWPTSKDPPPLPLNHLMGAIYRMESSGKLKDALMAYRTVTRQRPDEAVAWLARGNAALESGFTDEAIASFYKVTTLKTWQPMGWNNLALALLKKGKRKSARQILNKGLDYFPGHNLMLTTKAEIFPM